MHRFCTAWLPFFVFFVLFVVDPALQRFGLLRFGADAQAIDDAAVGIDDPEAE